MNIYKYIRWLAAGTLVLSMSSCNLGNAATQTPEDNTNAGTSYTASNQVTSNCTAIGVESVTVGAGTFDAVRVECQTDMNITIALDSNNPVSTPISLTGINWYVQDVGLVKNSTTSPGIESTTELVSYNIP